MDLHSDGMAANQAYTLTGLKHSCLVGCNDDEDDDEDAGGAITPAADDESAKSFSLFVFKR